VESGAVITQEFWILDLVLPTSELEFQISIAPAFILHPSAFRLPPQWAPKIIHEEAARRESE
jgi:hypothetical protein